MRRRVLGKTGLGISELGFGGLFASALGPGFEASRRAVFRAVDLGIDYFDTAPAYADSEEVLGRILREVPGARLVVSTKLGGRPQPGDRLPFERRCHARCGGDHTEQCQRNRRGGAGGGNQRG